jgi:hypothetical protein
LIDLLAEPLDGGRIISRGLDRPRILGVGEKGRKTGNRNRGD